MSAVAASGSLLLLLEGIGRLITDSDFEALGGAHELEAAHGTHGFTGLVRAPKVSKANFLTSFVAGNAGFDEAVEVREGLGNIR